MSIIYVNVNFELLSGENLELLDGDNFDLLELKAITAPGSSGKAKRKRKRTRSQYNDDEEIMELVAEICMSGILRF